MELKIDNAAIEKLVQEHIRVALAGVLQANSAPLISRIVDYAMNEKDPGSYGRHTILESAISKMIREEALAASKEWMDSKRPEIRKLVLATLARKSDGLVAKVVDQLVAGLSSGLKINVLFGGE
jgi:hypothetical protein